MGDTCVYKILVKGKKKNCYKLIDMIPNSYLIIIKENGSDDNFELIFSGECTWSIDAYTNDNLRPKPYTDEEIEEIEEGFCWNIPLKGKSIILNCEILCNSRDVDDGYSVEDFVHYNKGKKVKDKCPEELRIYID
jgi:hypothetical protein